MASTARTEGRFTSSAGDPLLIGGVCSRNHRIDGARMPPARGVDEDAHAPQCASRLFA
jgi:hypothetical protein